MANRFSQYVHTDYTPMPIDYYQQALVNTDQEAQQKVAAFGSAYAQAKSLTPYDEDAKAYYKQTLDGIESEIGDISKQNLKLPETLMKIQNVITNPKHVTALKNIMADTEDLRLWDEASKKHKLEYGNDRNLIDGMETLYNATKNKEGDASRYKPGRFRNLDQISKYIDLPKVIDERVGKLEADIKSGLIPGTQYYGNVEQKTLSKEKLREAAIKEISADPSMQAQLQRNIRYDYFKRNPNNPFAAMRADAIENYGSTENVKQIQGHINDIDALIANKNNAKDIEKMYGKGTNVKSTLDQLAKDKIELQNKLANGKNQLMNGDENSDELRNNVSQSIYGKYLNQLAATQDKKAYSQDLSKYQPNPIYALQMRIDAARKLQENQHKFLKEMQELKSKPVDAGNKLMVLTDEGVPNTGTQSILDKTIADNSFLKNYLPNGVLPPDYKTTTTKPIVTKVGRHFFSNPDTGIGEVDFGEDGAHGKNAIEHDAITIQGKYYPAIKIQGQDFIIEKVKNPDGSSKNNFIPLNKFIASNPVIDKTNVDFNTSPQIVDAATKYGWSPSLKDQNNKPIKPVEYLAQDARDQATLNKSTYHHVDFNAPEVLGTLASMPNAVHINDENGKSQDDVTQKTNILSRLIVSYKDGNGNQKAGLSTLIKPSTQMMDIVDDQGKKHSVAGIKFMDAQSKKSYVVSMAGMSNNAEQWADLHDYSVRGTPEKPLTLNNTDGSQTVVTKVRASHSSKAIGFQDVNNPLIEAKVNLAVQSVAEKLAGSKSPTEADYKRAIEMINEDAGARLRQPSDKSRVLGDKTADNKSVPRVPGMPDTGEAYYITGFEKLPNGNFKIKGSTLNEISLPNGQKLGGAVFVDQLDKQQAKQFFNEINFKTTKTPAKTINNSSMFNSLNASYGLTTPTDLLEPEN